MKSVYFLLLLLIGWACSKEEPANSLVGTWRLTIYCKPVSGSVCAPVIVPADKNVFISFTNDGKFNEMYENTKPLEYGFLGCGSGTYQIEGNSIRIIALCMSSSNGRLIPLISMNADQLVLNPFGTGDYIFARIR